MKDGAGRTLAAALLVAAAIPAATARAATEGVGPEAAPSGGPASGWATQRWPMHGQRGDQRRRITEDFTNAQHRLFGGPPSYPSAWREFRSPGNSEVVTAHVPGLELIGPHASLAVSTGYSMLGGFNVTVAPAMGGFTSIPSICGSYVGTPIMVSDSETFPFEGQIWVFGSPMQVKLQVGIAFVYAATSCGLLTRTFLDTAYFTIPLGSGPPVPALLAEGAIDQARALSGVPLHSPAMRNGIVYVATKRDGPTTVNGVWDDHVYLSGVLHAYGTGGFEDGMSDQWQAALQTGSGSTGPLPKGQEPPPGAERFWPTTPVAVSDTLVVVGCQGWYDDYSWGFRRELSVGYALMAYDTDTGTQRWVYKVDAEILPTPAITDELVVFGTRNGRVYALEHDGSVKWQTGWADRVTYRTHPYSNPQSFADAALYGPAIDQAGGAAYFGGSDGRVHRFDVSSGGHSMSEVLMYFREIVDYWWGLDPRRDQNGLEIIRPCPISSAPAIYKNRWLVVKNHTNTQAGWEGGDYDRNGAFACILSLPDLKMNPNVRNWTNGVRLDPDDRVFRAGGNAYGAIGLNSSGGGLWGFHSLHQISYINDPDDGIYFGQGVQTDTGGVSLSDGFVFVTDGAGHICAIPSNDEFEADTGSGTVRPLPPDPGPEPLPGPPALGPVEAFPNPFMPARAKGGTFKFRNLPMGSRVEIYTLAFERVKSLAESNYRAEWNATNEAGQPVATGVYLYKVFFPDDRPPLTGRVALTR